MQSYARTSQLIRRIKPVFFRPESYRTLKSSSMEKLPRQYDRECMKMAMLRHEETFKHQVNELHRVYRIQKTLMNDMKSEPKKKQKEASNLKLKSYKSSIEKRLDLKLNTEKYIEKENKDGNSLGAGEEEEDLELTLATGSRRKKDEASLTSDSGASFSWSSTGSSGVKLEGQTRGLFQLNCFHSEDKSAYDDEEPLRQNPWLLQCLSLNMT